MTDAHNEVRAQVGVRPVAWSTELAAYAQKWATNLAAHGCELAHRTDDAYGENLFWKMGTPGASVKEVVTSWAAEQSSYRHATNTCAAGSTCGHYTQLVWAKTIRIGCGRAACGNQEVWVCNYDPPGNFVGQAPY
jgi:pathogenesis-related protein 1